MPLASNTWDILSNQINILSAENAPVVATSKLRHYREFTIIRIRDNKKLKERWEEFFIFNFRTISWQNIVYLMISVEIGEWMGYNNIVGYYKMEGRICMRLTRCDIRLYGERELCEFASRKSFSVRNNRDRKHFSHRVKKNTDIFWLLLSLCCILRSTSSCISLPLVVCLAFGCDK